jgi:hypothetical protein
MIARSLRTSHRPPHRPSRLAGFAIAALLAAACRTGAPAARTPTCTDADAGTLRVTNQSGRMVEIYSASATNPRMFVGNASPGTTTFRVAGPSDLDVRYAALDPTRGAVYATVSWLRPHARGGSSQVLLDLNCESTR